MTDDNLLMSRCLQLASLGLGTVQPNPMVGAVIVHNGKIIGEGWHQKYGEPHAEVNAIASVKDKTLLKDSCIYVSLEPCSHFGKTPPCADLIIQKKIRKVVIATLDPNPKVAGNGVKKLKEAGIEVVTSVMEKESRGLNKRFFTYHEKKRPYIILKFAQTANGFMDIDRSGETVAASYWITNPMLKVFSHQLRNQEQAIAVGYQTYCNDQPQLSNRLFGSHQPEKFVLLNQECHFELASGFSPLPNQCDRFCEELYAKKIQSVIVEGGKKTLEMFLNAGCYDEVLVYKGSQNWDSGTAAPIISGEPCQIINVGDNEIWKYTR